MASSPTILPEATRRVDFVFGIGYGDDIAKAKATIERLVSEDSRSLADPAPLIVVSELADSSVNITTASVGKRCRLLGLVLRPDREGEADLRSGRHLHSRSHSAMCICIRKAPEAAGSRLG